MVAENTKKGEIHLIRGLGNVDDKKMYLEKLQKLTLNDIFDKKKFSKNSPEDETIGLGIDVPDEISVTSSLTEEESFPIVNDFFELQVRSELDFLTKLLHSEDDVNEVEFQKQKPLHIAIKNGSIDMVHSLIDKGANVNILGRRNKTALHICLEKDRLKIAQLLLASGADINAKDIKGDTPLFLAVKLDKFEVAKFFIENGADITVKNNAGLHIGSLDKSSLSSEMKDLVDFEEKRIPLKLAMIAKRKSEGSNMHEALDVVNKHRYSFFKIDEGRPKTKFSITI